MAAIEPFEVFAVRYAHHGPRKASENFIGGDLHEEGSPLDFFVWVARRSDRVFLVDTGFGEAAAQRRQRQLLRRPASALRELGIAPEAVDDVVISHLHWDHAGTLDDYPRARFHLQDREMHYATGRCMCHQAMRMPFDADDLCSVIRHLHAGRVHFHDGAEELADGFSVHRIGGHTDGIQAARVWTKRGWTVLASDATHLYANMNDGRPFPIVYNVGDMLEGHKTLRRLADSADHVIPGHDPLVMTYYPPLAPQFAGLAVRLDVAPRR
jgi:glyoxylase-like metal-dependent hydrolase (beta-lactamase superfamily II)